ncbi:MAG: hypothetical protein CBD16_08545 [Betaproteobacteria bacterium TMED156]|nr:MAG: hypothetical protein CBD16_08545 [Betaproteobacteria bacterium TMED156]
MSLGQFSNLAERLVGQEMFFILDRAKQIEEAGGKVRHLELGDPGLIADATIIKHTYDFLRRGYYHYTSSSGEESLKKAISALIKNNLNNNVDYSNIVVSPANFLITNFLSLVCDKGDSVFILTPAFPTYFASASMLGLNVIEFPCFPENGYLPDESIFETLEKTNPKAIFINSANNPTGAVYSKDFLSKIVSFAKDKNIWLLSDETYALLTYEDEFYSMLDFDCDNIVVISSLSKIFSIPGYRLGFQVSSSDEFNAYSNKFLSTTLSCCPPFLQLGCSSFLENKNLVDQVIQDVKKEYRNRINTLFDEVPKLESIIKKPKSAFYLFIPISKNVNGNNFCLDLLNEDKIAVTPGIAFGKDFSSFLRVAFCGVFDDIAHGLKSIVSKV